MEVTNCKDINGNDISEIQLNTDGTVLAVLEIEGVSSTSKLSYQCCTDNGYTFDPTDSKCYWSDSCTTSNYKVILNADGNDGAIYQIDDNQIGHCKLEVELDFLIKFDCAKVESLKNTVEALKLEVSLEKEIYNENLPIPNNLLSVYKEDLFNVDNISTYLNGNTNTGLLLDGIGCDSLIQNLITDLGPIDSQSITTTSFESGLVNHKFIIDDVNILEQIYNERIKIVILVNNLYNFSLMIDNVKLNRVCESDGTVEYLNSDCPKFEIKRIVDNKKSWVSNDIAFTREFDLERRKTVYNINDDKLSINTKEIDLLINPSIAVENDVLNFTKEYPTILDPVSGCTSGHTCVNITNLLTTPLEDVTNGTDFLNELIDVKSRKTIRTYPTIDLLYDRYINSEEYYGIESNSLTTESIDTFVDYVGSFWSDLIEQVVPATTIWGSSFQLSNNVFGSTKFKYKKSTLLMCNTIDMQAPSPAYPDTVDPKHLDVGVITTDITDTGYFGPPELEPPFPTQSCDGVYLRQINDGSEFIGTITIIGEGGNNTTGNTITLNETIDSSCDIYIEGDFNPCDFDNNDWDSPITQ